VSSERCAPKGFKGVLASGKGRGRSFGGGSRQRSVKQRTAGTNYEFKRPAFVSRCLFLCFCADRIVSRARQREGGRRREPSRIKPGARALWDLRRLCAVPYRLYIRDFLPRPLTPLPSFYSRMSLSRMAHRLAEIAVPESSLERDLPTIYFPSINFSRRL